MSAIRRIALLLLLGLLPASVAAQRHIGELSVAGGYAGAAGGPIQGGALGGAASFAFVLGPLTLGPEVGYYHFGGDGRATMLGGVVRVRLLRTAPSLYAVGGLAQGEFRGPVGINLFSGSAGLGAAWSPAGEGWALILEGRWHASLQNSGGAGQPAFMALLAGGRVRW